MSTKITFDMPDFSLILENATDTRIEETGFKVEEEAKKSAPAISGYYRNNIKFDRKSKVVANANYSAALEYGTMPHIIKPKDDKKALHFKTKDGKEVFAKVVKHPGTKPLAIMRKAALKVQKQSGAMFLDNFKRRLKKNV